MAGTVEHPEVAVQQPSSPTASTSSREETRDARERLKKTSIAGLSQKAKSTDISPDSDHLAKSDASVSDPAKQNQNGIRGRPAKKRSFEDLAKDDGDTDTAGTIGQPPLPKSGHHKRMRSRDINSGDHAQAYAKVEGDKNETVHEESDMSEETDMDAHKSPGGPGVLVGAPSEEDMAADTADQPLQIDKKNQSPMSTQESTNTVEPATTTK